MLKVNIKDLTVGMVTATPTYSKTGQLLFPAHTTLTSQQISYLEFYGIPSIQILPENHVTEELLDGASQEETISFSQKVRKSREFHAFKVDYTKKTQLVKDSFNRLITQDKDCDPNLLFDQISSLYSNHLTSLSVFDMLHNMRQIDDSTYSHCINVAIISRMMGKWLNFSENDLNVLTVAGVLHDIGKCMVDHEILTKPSALTDEEYKAIQNHPILGAKIVEAYPLDERIRSAILMHHERCDGSGYPNKLMGKDISEFAKIIAIADVYDAMTASRCYRKGLCPFEVIATFEREGFNKYDAQYLIPFLNHVINTYISNSVLLNDGTLGKIIFINKDFLSRPMIQTSNGDYIDLFKRPELYIQAII
ncbi:HD-GYP domain-containing protein [Lachnospiraceae bacterium 29-84]